MLTRPTKNETGKTQKMVKALQRNGNERGRDELWMSDIPDAKFNHPILDELHNSVITKSNYEEQNNIPRP